LLPSFPPRRSSDLPLLPAAPCGPRASTAPGPAVGGQGRQHRLHLMLLPSAPDILLARDGPDLRLCALLQPDAPPPILALDALARHPSRRHPRIASTRA